MADLASISKAAGEALKDAEAHKAAVACHFLRVILPQLFREAHHAPKRPADSDRFKPHDAKT